MISIEQKPYSTTFYYAGEYINNDKTYVFTLIEMDNSIEITWVDETPDNSKNIERDIEKIFISR